jgi:hypothetical protein
VVLSYDGCVNELQLDLDWIFDFFLQLEVIQVLAAQGRNLRIEVM